MILRQQKRCYAGFSVYYRKQEEFVYQHGAVFCNLLLADEINRTSPKTQSDLLEVMEERRVTVEGITRDVPSPFLVIATQNPSGSSGTQYLPEAQVDHFMVSMTLGYPRNPVKSRGCINLVLIFLSFGVEKKDSTEQIQNLH